MTTECDGRLPLDVVFDLLTSRRRRYLLYCLFTCASPITLPTVADRVTEWETGRVGADAPEKRLRIYMGLYHDHLPKMVDYDVVSYSQEDDVVALDANAEQFEPYVERAYEDEITEPMEQ